MILTFRLCPENVAVWSKHIIIQKHFQLIVFRDNIRNPTLDRKTKCLHIICFKVASWSRRTRNSGTRTPCRPDGYDADYTFKGRRFADGLYTVVNRSVGWNCGDQVGLPFPNNIFFFIVSTLISVYILFYR